MEVATSALWREVLVPRRAVDVYRLARLVAERAVHAWGTASLVPRPRVLVLWRARLVDGRAMLVASIEGFDASAASLVANIVSPDSN